MLVNSIRSRLLFSILAVLGVALLTDAVLGHRVATHEVDEVFDAQLISLARVIKGVLDREDIQTTAQDIGSALELTLSDIELAPPELRAYERSILIQLWDADGTELIFQSANAPDVNLAPFVLGFHYNDESQLNSIVYVMRLTKSNVWLQVAEIPYARQELMKELIEIYSITGAISLIVCFILAWLSIKYGLKRLHLLNRILKKRSGNNMSQIVLEDSPYELVKIVTELNQLFERVEGTLERERQFTSNAAHELRTPLAVIKLQIQSLEGQLEEKNYADLQMSINRCQSMIDQLMMLARLDHGEQLPEKIGVDIEELCRQIVAKCYPEANEKEVNLSFSSEGVFSHCCIQAGLFSIALENIITNSIKHGPSKNNIAVSVRCIPSQHTGLSVISICVEDEGGGVKDNELGNLTNRFYRANKEKAYTVGSGLGLSIVKRICDYLNMNLDISNASKGLKVEIFFEVKFS